MISFSSLKTVSGSFYLRYNGVKIDPLDVALFKKELKKAYTSEYKEMVDEILGPNPDFDYLFMYLSDKLQVRGDDSVNNGLIIPNTWCYFEFE